MDKLIISVHTPKTAGTSFIHQIQNIYGNKNVLLDYDDDPVANYKDLDKLLIDYSVKPRMIESQPRVIHGHFNPHKYAHLDNTFKVTFLRHPLNNLISIYNFWNALDRNVASYSLFLYFKDNNISLEEFAVFNEIKFLYTKAYFRNVNLNEFDFVGDFENYDMELSRLGKRLDRPIDISIRRNVTSELTNKPVIRDLPQDRIDYLKTVLSDDINFFEKYAGRI